MDSSQFSSPIASGAQSASSSARMSPIRGASEKNYVYNPNYQQLDGGGANSMSTRAVPKTFWRKASGYATTALYYGWPIFGPPLLNMAYNHFTKGANMVKATPVPTPNPNVKQIDYSRIKPQGKQFNREVDNPVFYVNKSSTTSKNKK